MSGRGPAGHRRAGSAPAPGACGSRSGAAASEPTSAKAMAVRRAAPFGRCGCGGGRIGWCRLEPRCRCAGSAAPTPGARIRATGATTERFAGRPLNQVIGSGGKIASTMSLRCHYRDRSQHAAAGGRPGQRRLYPCGTAGLCPHRRLRRSQAARTAHAGSEA
jgi:hypothetical protein